MPTASAALRGGSTYATTYGSSYSTSSTIGRSNSATRRSSLSNGYGTSTNATSQYRTSRPLPTGPGPLDRHGRKLDGFSVTGLDTATRRARASPVGGGLSSTRSGPLKADHSTGYTASTRYNGLDRTSDYLSGTSTLNRKNSTSGLDPLPYHTTTTTTTTTSGNRLSGRRSSSLANLRLDDEPSSSVYSRAHHYDSEDRVGQRPSSRRGSRYNDDILGTTPRVGKTVGMSSEDKKESVVGGRLRYTPSASRESSPGTSNGIGTGNRGRQFGEARDEQSRSKCSSTSSSSSTSVNGKSFHRDGGKVGLRNLGNTCFMNSVLQCLSNTKPLLEWLLSDGYLLDINTTTSGMKGALIKAFANMTKSLWKESASESYVSPNAFKTQIQKFASRFMGYAQQDAQEFLRYLLEGIHEDVNRVTQKPKPVILDDNRLDSKHDRDKAKEYWNAYLTRDNSHILDIFVGQLKSELKFAECGHRSVTFDPFWDLSLPIPSRSRSSELSLDDCLRLFMKEEELEAEERPMCTKCKVRRSCTKSFSIHRFPQILVFHLKRFSQERYGRKLSTLVDFPVKGLKLTDYSSEGGQKVTYDLYAVSDHSGGVHSGHYTAICKNPYSGEWHTFNDTQVSPARSNQAVSSEAYILFYELTSPAGRL
ncbi:ubiquitin carboxyl-terminal hydrolase 2-like [Littorina saxatilis]|uniref:Ubiquitin carboxyl-terminal hydrolase n=1 Tax=Littorina saxatilis TaxID=31220 RepID=A0AAN9GEY5_9CAEN